MLLVCYDLKKFILMFGVIKEAIEMWDCICCGKAFDQLHETLMDETMALMIMDLLLQKVKQICLFGKDLVFRNTAVTRILQDMINIMISMIFILVLLDDFGECQQHFSPIGLSELAYGQLLFRKGKNTWNCCTSNILVLAPIRST